VSLGQQAQPFARHRRVEAAEAGDIASGLLQVSNELLADRIDDVRKDDRDRLGLLLQCSACRAARGHCRPKRDQLRCVALEEWALSTSPAPIDGESAAIPPAERGKLPHERGGARLAFGIIGAGAHEDADAACAVALLRMRAGRDHCRNAGDHGAPPD
jgi:hypothetical protein